MSLTRVSSAVASTGLLVFTLYVYNFVSSHIVQLKMIGTRKGIFISFGAIILY